MFFWVHSLQPLLKMQGLEQKASLSFCSATRALLLPSFLRDSETS